MNRRKHQPTDKCRARSWGLPPPLEVKSPPPCGVAVRSTCNPPPSSDREPRGAEAAALEAGSEAERCRLDEEALSRRCKEIDARLKEQNEFLNRVIQSLPHPFYVLDAEDYHVKMANAAVGGGELTEAMTCYALTHRRKTPCDGLEHACPLQIVKRTKRPVILEHIHYDKAGNPRNVEVHGYPVFDESGNVVQMVEYALDITERKRMQEEIENYAEKIKRFAYSVSHDLKSPLIGINGLTRLLQKRAADSLDHSAKLYCDQIVKASEQALALIEEINVYIRTRESALKFEEVDSGEILETVRAEFEAFLSGRGIQWSASVLLPSLRADRLSLLRVFRNLVDNAMKYGGKDLRTIRIGYEESAEHHTFFVSDDGAGIKQEDCEKIFDLFQRSRSSTGAEGTGLGLAIVREIAERHRGKVWVEPGKESGATFYFSISKLI